MEKEKIEKQKVEEEKVETEKRESKPVVLQTMAASPPQPDPTTLQTLAYETEDATFQAELDKAMMTENSWWKVEKLMNQDLAQPSGATSSLTSTPGTTPKLIEDGYGNTLQEKPKELATKAPAGELHTGLTDEFAGMNVSTPIKQPDIPSLEAKQRSDSAPGPVPEVMPADPAQPAQPEQPVVPTDAIQPEQPLAPSSIEPGQPLPGGDDDAEERRRRTVENGLESGLQDPAHEAQGRMAELMNKDDDRHQEVESIPDSPVDGKKTSPATAETMEVAKASILSALEGMLKEGFDLDGAIARLKDEDNLDIPVVSRIEQFQNKKTNQPEDEAGDNQDGKDDNQRKPGPRKPGPKPRGKAKAKAKAKAKGQPKKKASPKPKTQGKKEGPGKMEEVEEHHEEPQEPVPKIEKRKSGKIEKGEEGSKDGPEAALEPSKKAKSEPKSFARRPCPTTSPAKDKWVAIMQTFRGEIQQKLKDGGEKPSKWEDMGYKSYALYTLQAYIIHPIFFKKCFKFHRLILLGPVVFQSNPGISFEKHGVVVDPIDSVSFFRSLSGTLRQKPSRNVRRRDPWRHQSMRRSHLVVFRTCSS